MYLYNFPVPDYIDYIDTYLYLKINFHVSIHKGTDLLGCIVLLLIAISLNDNRKI